jgi:2-polyprenyl-6-methoxyphenol hydroxylase-like FAD-dependent oxidoreductase
MEPDTPSQAGAGESGLHTNRSTSQSTELNKVPLVGFAGLLKPPGGTAGSEPWTEIEACPDGWWYSAPLPAGQLLVVYLTDADLLGVRHGRLAAIWWKRLQRTCRTAGRAACSLVQTVYAAVCRREPVAGLAWAATGDAAAALDPLSGQGLVQALEGGMRAGSAILAWLQGDVRPLDAYAHWVKASFARHLILRAHYHAQERRWPGAPSGRAGTARRP